MLDLVTRTVETSTLGKILLVNVGLTDKDITALKDLLEENPQITSINVSENKLTKQAAYLLCQIKSLKRISMCYTELDHDGTVFLLSKPNLEFLDISGNKNIGYDLDDLVRARRSQGVEIIAEDTPLDMEYIKFILQDRFCEFSMKEKPKSFWRWW